MQMRVGPAVNDVQLTELFPNTEYKVTVQAALHDLTSEPVTAREVTCKTFLILHFSFAITIMSIRLFLLFNDANHHLIICA